MSQNDPTDIDGQRRRKAETAEQRKRDRDDSNSDLRWLMSNKRGRRIIWRLLEQAGVYRLSFAPSANAMQMAFAEGNRNSGLALLKQILECCAEQYTVMLLEHTKNERTTDDHGR